jgi:hypothetical protein
MQYTYSQKKALSICFKATFSPQDTPSKRAHLRKLNDRFAALKKPNIAKRVNNKRNSVCTQILDLTQTLGSKWSYSLIGPHVGLSELKRAQRPIGLLSLFSQTAGGMWHY